MCPEQLEVVPEYIETFVLGACRNTQTHELLPGTLSNGDLVWELVEGLGTLFEEGLYAEGSYLFLRHDAAEAFGVGPLRKAGWARLRMPDKVALVGRFAGITLFW